MSSFIVKQRIHELVSIMRDIDRDWSKTENILEQLEFDYAQHKIRRVCEPVQALSCNEQQATLPINSTDKLFQCVIDLHDLFIHMRKLAKRSAVLSLQISDTLSL